MKWQAKAAHIARWIHVVLDVWNKHQGSTTIAYPGPGMIHGTYSLESLREGVDDLCYAVQAHRAVSLMLASANPQSRRTGTLLRTRFIAALEPWLSLMPEGRRIDLAVTRIESRLQETRTELAQIIAEARTC